MCDETGAQVAQILDGRLRSPILKDIVLSNKYDAENERFEVDPDTLFEIFVGPSMQSKLQVMRGSNAAFASSKQDPSKCFSDVKFRLGTKGFEILLNGRMLINKVAHESLEKMLNVFDMQFQIVDNENPNCSIETTS